MSKLPDVSALILRQEGATLFVTIHQPEVKNALTDDVIDALEKVCTYLESARDIRALVLRGSDGMFCSGGDIRTFKRNFETPLPEADERDRVAIFNRRFGLFLERFNMLPQTTIGVIEGGAFGGGLGLACTVDIGIAHTETRFALTETSLGVLPAQIAPFVVQRVGLTNARRLALSGARFKGEEAKALGVVHFVCATTEEIEAQLERVLTDIGRCAPGANAATKKILQASLTEPLVQVLEDAADAFARQLRSPEGQEGVKAFLEKRPAQWVGKR
jgi:isohexenylglutaconyl-CoA hydratase